MSARTNLCGCGRLALESESAAKLLALSLTQEATTGSRTRVALDCGENWHVVAGPWKGGRRGTAAERRKAKRAEAIRRDARTDPRRRSAKGRVKRPKKNAPEPVTAPTATEAA